MHQIDYFKDDEMGGVCKRHGRRELHAEFQNIGQKFLKNCLFVAKGW